MGIFGGQGPNPSAAIMLNGALIAMAEEERFTRIKNAPSALPIKSIKFCLDFAKIKIADIEKIGFGWDCENYERNWPQFSKNMRSEFESISQEYDLNYEARILNNFNPIRIKEDLKFGLAKVGITLDTSKIVFLNHHKCHAASTFFQSGFEEAAILSIDGSGEEVSTSVWHGKQESMEMLRQINLPDTLGGFYATFTEFLGFKANSEEGKLMGLAPYGEYSEQIQQNLDKFIYFDHVNNTYKVNLKLRFIGARSQNNLFTDEFVSIFGSPRLSNEEITKYHMDLAFNVQFRLEEIVQKLALQAIADTNSSNLCLAGGVAMNCKLNGKLALLEQVDSIFVQPASSDNGISIGAAILMSLESGVKEFKKLEHCYFGPEYDNTTIEKILIESKIQYKKVGNPTSLAAKDLNEGLLIGWFQGRSEFGARSLGNRSILANPMFPNMKDKLNLEVKHRENWRPFCPSIKSESYHEYFGDVSFSPFMILAFPVKQKYHSLIPAVVHVDGTARPQAVEKQHNNRFHELLTKFEELSGHPVLINTSFNVQGEPIVNSPLDALRCFFSTGLDKVYIGDFLIEKNDKQ